MKLRQLTAMTAAALLSTGAWAQAQTTAPAGSEARKPQVLSAKADYTPTMEALVQAAQHLRQSIQAIAGKPAGPARDRAIAQAREALIATQRAMVHLPAHLRDAGTTIEGRSYEESMEQLDKAADKLLRAVEAMAGRNTGPRVDQARSQAQEALWDTYEAMLAMPTQARAEKVASANGGSASKEAGAAGDGRKTARNAKASPAGDAKGYALMVVPVNIVTDDRLANGCWARVYENPQFGGNVLTLVGPVDVPDLARTAVSDWNGADSVVTGPKARVTVYDEENYRDRMAAVEPGKSVAHLQDRSVGFLDKAESLRVAC